MSQIRTRIAPSPTGDPHVGTAYIALFNWCFARQQGGKFILRVEDTDQHRSTTQSEHDILNSLNWLGLTWDEGPDCGGDFGPYRQSQRSEIYRQHIDQLLDKQKVFRCFCSSERLDQIRQQQQQEKLQPGYDGHCLGLSDEEIVEKLTAGEPHVIRMTKPESGDCVFDDLLRGEVRISWSQVDMQVLIKSDDLPTYHFANVVDDHLMQISHVIRGEEWINSTPKHLLLYAYFDWQPPVFCHMPLLRNPDKSKLSKRKNPTSIGYYRAMGYLPQALANYLGMMGWSMPSGDEKYSIEEMAEAFDLTRVSLGGPIFDTEKLDWLNGKYIREDLSDAQFAERYGAWAFSSDKVAKIVPLLKQRVERFSDVAGLGGFFLSGLLDIDMDDFAHKTLDAQLQAKILQFSLWRLEQLQHWQRDNIEDTLQSLSNSLQLKIRDFLFPLFVAISGKAVSTSVIESIQILGMDICRARMRHAIAVLGGISKKQAKLLEREFRDLS
ncbi:MAG TPA: glutamate--tRNA ligase [Gammaproteobacteria bacterium]|nr:glutamate--tRNA ligase [Gammaproteobacteria bacterium]|tara:strand:- start:138 stop:1622 length:1485 start_codon:yes stop_codon:yes gene_type:complete